MKLTLPTTRATTAYGYLTAIAKLVLEEPKRLNMGVVVLKGTGLQSYLANHWDREKLKKRQPSCGTVGCIAGWTLTLAGKVGEDDYNLGYMNEAQFLLGLTYAQREELFTPPALLDAANKQTPAHARATVKHIQAFQKKYAKQLKATKIVKAVAA